jgi:hypothetical protein
MRPDPAPARPVSPLFKADKATLTLSREAGGKMRVVYTGWDDAKVLLAGQGLQLTVGPQGVEARVVAVELPPGVTGFEAGFDDEPGEPADDE